MSKLNTILIVVIVVVFAMLGYFGFQAWQARKMPKANTPAVSASVERVKLMTIENKGKESEDRDAILEADVRKVDSAVKEYDKKIYCARTPMVLETANTMVFQCSHDACGRVEFEKACQ